MQIHMHAMNFKDGVSLLQAAAPMDPDALV